MKAVRAAGKANIGTFFAVHRAYSGGLRRRTFRIPP
jgi:hypothetical protein